MGLKNFFVNKCCGYLDHYYPWLNWRYLIVVGISIVLAVIAIDMLGAVLSIGLIVAGLTYLYLNGCFEPMIMLLQNPERFFAELYDKIIKNCLGTFWSNLVSFVGNSYRAVVSGLKKIGGTTSYSLKNIFIGVGSVGKIVGSIMSSFGKTLFSKREPKKASDHQTILIPENDLKDSKSDFPNAFEDSLEQCRKLMDSSLKVLKNLMSSTQKTCDGFIESAQKNYHMYQKSTQKQKNYFNSSIKKSEDLMKSTKKKCEDFQVSFEQKCENRLKSVKKSSEYFQAFSSKECKNIIVATKQKCNNLVDSADMELKNCVLPLQIELYKLIRKSRGIMKMIPLISWTLSMLDHFLDTAVDIVFVKHEGSIKSFKKTQTDREKTLLKDFDECMTSSNKEITGLLNSLQAKRDDQLQATQKKCRKFEAAIKKECDEQTGGLKEEFDRLMESSQNIPRDVVDTFLKKCNDLMEQHQKKCEDLIESAEKKFNGFENLHQKELLKKPSPKTLINYYKSFHIGCGDLMESIRNICNDLIISIENECTCFEKSAQKDGVENSIARTVMNSVEDKCTVLTEFYRNEYNGALKIFLKECHDSVNCRRQESEKFISNAEKIQSAVLDTLEKECDDVVNSKKEELWESIKKIKDFNEECNFWNMINPRHSRKNEL